MVFLLLAVFLVPLAAVAVLVEDVAFGVVAVLVEVFLAVVVLLVFLALAEEAEPLVFLAVEVFFL